MTQKILEVKNLHTSFFHKNRTEKIVDGIDITVQRGETLGVTGESGSGKSILALSLLDLVPPPGKIVTGEIWFKDRDLLTLSDDELNNVRGEEIALIPQNPTTSQDPLMIIGLQSGEVLKEHRKMEQAQIREKVIEYLGRASLPDPQRDYTSYAHEFSQGMNQRVMIAAALLCAPSLLIADEPTSSLDVTVQRQVLELLKSIKESFHVSMIYITHDLGVIAEMSDHVAVMYAGKVVEYADVYTLFDNPIHPYTRGLLGSLLPLTKRVDLHDIEPINGTPADASFRPSFCAFAPRCRYAAPRCHQKSPPTTKIGSDHFVQCFEADSLQKK